MRSSVPPWNGHRGGWSRLAAVAVAGAVAGLLWLGAAGGSRAGSGRLWAQGTAAGSPPPAKAPGEVRLLNVSYDPTREFYADFNAVFAQEWLRQSGQKVSVQQSHGGSGQQAQAVLDGLAADVVTLGLAYDVDALAAAGLVGKDWARRLPDNGAPYTSTIVFLVRKGNPKAVKDWSDLVRPGVGVITPNPKTSSGGRWNYLAAWGWATRQNHGDERKAQDYVTRLYKNVPKLDAGARGATNSFVEQGLGDVLIAWENEAFLATRELGPDKFAMVVPPVSILAEPPVAVVDKVVDKRGTRAVAEAYLKFLYTEAGQELAAKHYYRPRNEAVAARHAAQFPRLELFTVGQVFGTWSQLHEKHFAEGGVFDQISGQ